VRSDGGTVRVSPPPLASARAESPEMENPFASLTAQLTDFFDKIFNPKKPSSYRQLPPPRKAPRRTGGMVKPYRRHVFHLSAIPTMLSRLGDSLAISGPGRDVCHAL
jgi:hypothetical protein